MDVQLETHILILYILPKYKVVATENEIIILLTFAC